MESNRESSLGLWFGIGSCYLAILHADCLIFETYTTQILVAVSHFLVFYGLFYIQILFMSMSALLELVGSGEPSRRDGRS